MGRIGKFCHKGESSEAHRKDFSENKFTNLKISSQENVKKVSCPKYLIFQTLKELVRKACLVAKGVERERLVINTYETESTPGLNSIDKGR